MRIYRNIFLLFIYVYGNLGFTEEISLFVRNCEKPLVMWSIENSKLNKPKRHQIDFWVDIENKSSNTYKFYEPWNSWGYYNLKLIFSDGVNEYPVNKHEGIWYRNFESFFRVQSAKKYSIPVALSSDIWDMDKVEKTRKIQWMRVMYNQIYSKPFRDYDEDVTLWCGIQTSEYYSMTNVLSASTISNIWYGTSNTNNVHNTDNMRIFEYPIQIEHTTNECFNNAVDVDIELNIE